MSKGLSCSGPKSGIANGVSSQLSTLESNATGGSCPRPPCGPVRVVPRLGSGLAVGTPPMSTVQLPPAVAGRLGFHALGSGFGVAPPRWSGGKSGRRRFQWASWYLGPGVMAPVSNPVGESAGSAPIVAVSGSPIVGAETEEAPVEPVVPVVLVELGGSADTRLPVDAAGR